MKRILRTIIVLLIVGIGGIFVYLKFVLPDVDKSPDIKITVTPERVQHGRYLAMHVAACMDCHSKRDWSSFAAPPVSGTLGEGGEYFGPEMGFPGKFYSKNITPANLKDWTDGEIFRAITSGVDKDGKALFPVMPYLNYGKLDKEDIYDIIAFIRSLPPIVRETPESKASFPMNFIINTIPSKPQFATKPDRSDSVQYGAYLVNMAGCRDCHTKVEKGQLIMEQAFAGGRDFKMPRGTVYSANISPDKENGIGKWTEDEFISRFKNYLDPVSYGKLRPGQVNTVMPWAMFAGMDTSDLRSIYLYLQTVKPMKNKVVHFVANTDETTALK
jgi:hypothetical protein